MSKSLQTFYNDQETRDNVYNYLIDFLEKDAIKKVFDKKGFEEISAIGSAKEVIDKAFENLSVLFETKPKKNIINQVR